MREWILMFMLASLIITGLLNRNNLNKIYYNFNFKEIVSEQVKEQVKKECLK